MKEELDNLKKQAVERGKKEKKIIEIFISIIIIIIVIAFPIFIFFNSHFYDTFITYKIKQNSMNDKINSIIAEDEYDININLVKAKLVSKWNIRSKSSLSGSNYYKKYKVLENNEYFVIGRNDLRI